MLPMGSAQGDLKRLPFEVDLANEAAKWGSSLESLQLHGSDTTTTAGAACTGQLGHQARW
jgi:hypothetical protein